VHEAPTAERRRVDVSTTGDLGRANAASVLSCVLTEGPLARAEIAERVGLTRATVTRVANRLIELGLLSEEAPRRDAPGRPMVPLAFHGGSRVTLAVHLGARESRVGVVDLRGRVLAETRDSYTDTAPAGILDVVAARVREAVERHAARQRILGVGVSLGGWVDAEAGEVVRFDPLGWRRVPLGAELAARTGLPVHVDQMVRGLALAEKSFGAVRDMTDFLELWTGNVVGAAVVLDGEVRRTPGGASGVLTHFPVRGGWGRRCECGRLGCLAANVTDAALVAEAVRRGLVAPDAKIHDLMRVAAAHEPAVAAFVDEVARMAGEAAAAMVDLLNPRGVVIAGLITTAPGYLESFRSEFSDTAELGAGIDVRASAFGDLAPTIASASVVLDRYLQDPLAHER
jgi:predicted NBD/HSP70 family sugar kinase